MLSSDQSSVPDQQGAPTDSPPSIPGHQMLRQIAHGSYGEIWLARTELGASRAVKIIRRATFSNAKPFDREFAGIQRYEPISREHDGLVDVLQVGRDEAAGFFYYVMELADDAEAERSDGVMENRICENNAGQHRSITPSLQHPKSYTSHTLALEIGRRTRLPVTKVIQLGISLARALEFLHSRRLVHRDIKPTNIIFVGRQPKLADVGLIADLDGPLTFVGTEGYIPPEGPGSAQADIYSLGKVLYEAATGNDRQEFPDLAMRLGEMPDKALLELNEVLLKACESNPRARYRTAPAMVADLERLNAGQSLRKRRAQRRRVQRIALTLAILAAVSIATVAVHLASKPIFVDEFDRSALDTNSWNVGSVFSGLLNQGRREFITTQTNDELVLRCLDEQDGDSIATLGWIELKKNLRPLAPCRIEVDLSGSACRGRLMATISSGETPTNDSDVVGATLAEFEASAVNATNTWPAPRLRIDILPKGQVALVWSDINRLERFEVVDLASLALWRLRLCCRSVSSKDFGIGLAEFRIGRVVVSPLKQEDLVVGRVLEDVSKRPIAGAEVKGKSGRQLATTQTNGMFAIIRMAEAEQLTVEKRGFAPLRNQPFFPDETGPFVTAHLRKSKSEFGDPVEVISLENLKAGSIGFREGALNLLVYDSDTECSLLPISSAQKRILFDAPGVARFEFQSLHIVNEFAQCGSRFIGVRHWPGQVFELDSQPPKLLLCLTNQNEGTPLNWPNGCAFDGEFLWFVEHDATKLRFGLHALDLERKAIVHSRYSAMRMRGLAWDGKRFWISSEDGRVSAIERDGLLHADMLDATMCRQFQGHYDRLAFGEESLWGLDQVNRRICKIKVTD